MKWFAAAVCTAAFFSSGAAQAQDALQGRWGVSDAACSSWNGSTQDDTALMVSSYAILWHQGYCRVGRMYKTDKAVHIEAHCWTSGGDQSVPVTLEPTNGDKLKAVWNRGKPALLKRCL